MHFEVLAVGETHIAVRIGTETKQTDWQTLRDAAGQSDEVLGTIYRGILRDAEEKLETGRAAAGWYALVTFGTPAKAYECERVGQGLDEMRRLIRAGGEMLGTGGSLAVTCARVSRFATRAEAEAYDISMSGGTCVWQS